MDRRIAWWIVGALGGAAILMLTGKVGSFEISRSETCTTTVKSERHFGWTSVRKVEQVCES